MWQPLDVNLETTVESRPLDVETTSYGLLTYVLRGLTRDAIPIMRWLTRQRNQYGGFQSTQVGPGGSRGRRARLCI